MEGDSALMISQSSHAYAEPVTPAYDSVLYTALLQQYSTGITTAALGVISGPQPPPPALGTSLVPINADLFKTLAHVLAQVEQPSDQPRLTNESRTLISGQVVGEVAPPVSYLYALELDEIRTGLHQRRGSDDQEDFMFDVVAPFVENFGSRALHDIDLTLETMPRTAKYFFPYLLGHLDNEATLEKRLDMLTSYRESADRDVRDGALEALCFLDAT